MVTYRQSGALGGRQDLTSEQRRTVQTIWAVRRANQAAANGNVKRSLAILNAAARSFPDNPGVLRALLRRSRRSSCSPSLACSQDMTPLPPLTTNQRVGAALLRQGTAKSICAMAWMRLPKDAGNVINLGEVRASLQAITAARQTTSVPSPPCLP